MQLQATKRSKTGKGVRALRAEGKMPAVVYGPELPALAVELQLKDFEKALETAGESTIIELLVDGTPHNVLVSEVDRDPVTDTPRHADFYAVVKGRKVEVAVPLEFVGTANAVKDLSGNLVKALHEIEVEADPMRLPREITVDVSVLDALDKQILAKDLVLPEGVALVTGGDEVVATVVAAVEEKEEVIAAPDMETIGLSEERGKKEEEGAAEGADAAAEASS